MSATPGNTIKAGWVERFLVYKLCVLSLAFVGIATFAKIWPVSLSHLLGLFYQWDAKHILRVAQEGYLAAEPSIQVFPVFPLIIRLFYGIVWNWNAAGFLATQACSAAAFYFFYKLARLDLDERESTIALALFAFFPTAYVLTAPYTESAFCAFSFGCVYFFRRERFGWACALACLAAATRITGLLLAPAIFVHWLFHQRKNTRGATLAALGAVAGYGLYLGLNKYLYGNWFYYMGEQAKHWGVRLSWPFHGAFEAFAAWNTRSADQRMTIIIIEVGFTLAALAGLVIAWIKRLRPTVDLAYWALNLILLICMNFWLSRPRYVLTLYPMFLAAAPWLAKRTHWLLGYLFVSSALFGIYWALYLNAQWAH